jgi:hypothetical protein
MSGWQIVLGELLAPTAILTGIQWFLLMITMALSAYWPFHTWPVSLKLGIGFSAALLIPLLNLITLQIPNAAVLLLPAWFQSGKEGPQGIEATGQRLVFMLASLIAFALALLPAGIVFIGVWFLVRQFASMALVVPLSAIAAALILLIEGALGLKLLGWLFDRFDVSAESTP